MSPQRQPLTLLAAAMLTVAMMVAVNVIVGTMPLRNAWWLLLVPTAIAVALLGRTQTLARREARATLGAPSRPVFPEMHAGPRGVSAIEANTAAADPLDANDDIPTDEGAAETSIDMDAPLLAEEVEFSADAGSEAEATLDAAAFEGTPEAQQVYGRATVVDDGTATYEQAGPSEAVEMQDLPNAPASADITPPPVPLEDAPTTEGDVLVAGQPTDVPRGGDMPGVVAEGVAPAEASPATDEEKLVGAVPSDLAADADAPPTADAAYGEKPNEPTASAVTRAADVLPQDDLASPADDLRRVKGIGPKAAAALATKGVTTFAQLAELDMDTLTAIMRTHGVRLVGGVSTWAQQARLAATGQWQALDDYQKTL